ncbi:hypothetical protein GXW82_16805 [Streptacidiphilus sp. 4-A2]|nr:hypothetical protein [Streptacidiphilus sp. 4-A2]
MADDSTPAGYDAPATPAPTRSGTSPGRHGCDERRQRQRQTRKALLVASCELQFE